MAMERTEIERLLREAFPDAVVEVRDLAGDGDHYAATVVSEKFRGKTRVAQHKLVYVALQARLLRALQDGRIRPVGEEHEVSIDVRVIAASNRNLEELVERDEFRTDLYFRLETFRIYYPRRDRPDRITPVEVEAVISREWVK